MAMDKAVAFFQVCHATDHPLHEQRQCEAAAKKNERRQTKKRLPPTRNVLLLIETTLQAPPPMGPKNKVAQKISVATVNPKVMTLHGAHVLVIILDTQAIVSPWLVD